MDALKDIKGVINNNLSNDSTPNDQSDDPEHCICPECDYEEDLGLEDDCCTSKKCPECGAEMMDSVFNKTNEDDKEVSESDIVDWSGKIKKILESKLITTSKKTNKKICNECKTIISEGINLENGCPKCGEDIISLSDSMLKIIENSRRFICPKCTTSTQYTKINESECPVCNSLMTVFDKPMIKKQGPSLPIE